MNFKTSIPEGPGDGTPEMGTRPMPGKSNGCEETLRKGRLPQSSAAQDAKSDPGACLRAVDQQVGANGNGKKRDANVWGRGDAADKNEKALK